MNPEGFEPSPFGSADRLPIRRTGSIPYGFYTRQTGKLEWDRRQNLSGFGRVYFIIPALKLIPAVPRVRAMTASTQPSL